MSFIARDGLDYTAPMRIAGPRDHWDSLGILARAFGILVKEHLGVDVVYTDCRDSAQCVLAEMGCVGWATYASCHPTSTSEEAAEAVANGTKIYPDPLPDVFVALEQWPSSVDRTAGTPVPEAVEDHGMTGYPTDYNVLVSGPLVQTAWRDHRLDLLGYRAYMLPEIASVFSSPATVMADGKFVPTWGTVCPGTNGSRYSSSAQRFARDALYPHGWVCRNGWWLTPACAQLGNQWASQCVPLIQPDEWDAFSAPVYYGMAVAGMRVASVPVTGHLALATMYNVLYLGRNPVDFRYRALDPQAVVLQQWDNTTSRTLTVKTVWPSVLGTSAQVAIFIRQFVWSTTMLDGLMADMEAAYLQGRGPSDEAQPGFYQKVACDWLRNNAASWEPLLPDPTSCLVGEYFDNHTLECAPCPAGTKWVAALKGQDSCALCAPGETQDDPGRTDCAHCGRGSYNAQYGLTEAPDACPPCELGRYSSDEGSTSCEACPKGQSTREPGSHLHDQCICAAGFHDTKGFPAEADGEECARCGDGMECEVGQLIPALKIGYYSSPDDPLRVYKCGARVGQTTHDETDNTLCLGGFAGNVTCKDGRSGFLCQTCPEGLVATQSKCIKCNGRDYFGIVVVAIILAVAVFAVLAGSVRSVVKDDPRTMGAGSLFMQAINFVQVLAAIHSLGVSWGPPLADLMQILSVYTMDLDVIRIGCASLTHAVGKYAFKMSAPLGAVCVLVLAAQIANAFSRRVVLNFDAIFNAVGQVLTMTFITISLASLTPFQCFRHPDGESSLVTVPTVMCWHTQDHKIMVSLSVIALFIYVMSTMVMVLFAILRYPSEILKEDLHFVRRFRFLFFRFQPEHYWFAGLLMARNFALALYPMIVPPEMQGVSLILMQLTILFCCLISVHFFPWRGTALNWSDMAMNLTLQGVLIVATLAFMGGPMSVFASTILCICCAGGLVYCASAVLWKLSQRMMRTSDWALFLSHHKLGGACTARFLKAVLQVKLVGQVFLDSDDLSSLWFLLDAVRSSKALLVLLSPEVLNRPWCVGEIITAHQCNVPILMCTAACGPTATVAVQELLRIGKEGLSSRHGSLDVLRPHGISPEHAEAAFDALLTKSVVHLDFSQSQSLGAGLSDVCYHVRALAASRMRGRFPACVPITAFDGCGASMTVKRSKDWEMEANDTMNLAASTGQRGSFWVVLSDPLDVEAAAAARAVKVMLQPKVQRQIIVDTGASKQEVVEIFRSPRLETVVWMLTRGTLRSAPQLARLATLYKLVPSANVLPVIVGDRNATVPGPDFYTQLEAGLIAFGPGGGISEHAPVPLELPEVSAAVRQVFMNIATVVDVPAASEQMIGTSLAALIRNAQARHQGGRRGGGHGENAMSATSSAADSLTSAEPLPGKGAVPEDLPQRSPRTPAIAILAEASNEFWDDGCEWY